ncbi:MoaD/ThiS family protein [Gilvibacter sp.]|uniref:MoaD/ThiS family protein n=1 Tax=Gilvibacter sp. TaxID=2729997 RepID=UPI0025C713B0|nr:MoaD/ThiS family protein [Gilvibacter sp.]NQX77983.1 MoaD/ThiS family protein [Gilvibacter sp.]
MELTLKYFGRIAELTGKTEEIRSAAVETVDELDSVLRREYPGLSMATYSIAVDHEIVKPSFPLKSKVEVALLPPFSGG